MSALVSLIVSAVLGLLKMVVGQKIKQAKTPPEPTDVLAEHFDAIDSGDSEAFARRRRRHLGRLQSRGLRDDPTQAD